MKPKTIGNLTVFGQTAIDMSRVKCISASQKLRETFGFPPVSSIAFLVMLDHGTLIEVSGEDAKILADFLNNSEPIA